MQKTCWQHLAAHQQVLVVTTPNREEKEGLLHLYERIEKDSPWVPVGEPIAIVLGKTGLAWGIGLHPPDSKNALLKREGDKKSPAGIFSLGTAFGLVSALKMASLKLEYLQFDENSEAVDDPLSSYYNQIVNRQEVTIDWNSSEKMNEETLYTLGLVVNHNFPNSQPGAGSAIFLHVWRHKHSGTLDCTAMSQENLTKILFWLKRSKNPALVQLPVDIYHQLQEKWSLPQQ